MNDQIPKRWIFQTHADALAFQIAQNFGGLHTVIDMKLDENENEQWIVDLYVDEPACPDCGYNPEVEPHHGMCPSLRTDHDYEVREDLRHG